MYFLIEKIEMIFTNETFLALTNIVKVQGQMMKSI